MQSIWKSQILFISIIMHGRFFFISNDAFGLFLISFSFSCVILNFLAAVETSTISFCMAVASYL